MAQDVQVPILNGPSLPDLADALTHGTGVDENRPKIVFTVENKQITTMINGLIREDGSGNCWNIKGLWLSNGVWKRFSGFYETNNGKGFLVLEGFS